jgi:hypothetical protein
MKYLGIILIFVFVTYLLQNCSNSDSGHHEKTDSTYTALLYFSSSNFDFTVTTAKRYVITHKVIDTTDKSSPKYTWRTDTAYLVPVKVAVLDSLKKPKLDSLGKPVYSIQLAQLPKEFLIQDFNKDYRFK